MNLVEFKKTVLKMLIQIVIQKIKKKEVEIIFFNF
jgi:hypothetical protein